MKKIFVLLLVAMLLAPVAAMAADKAWSSVPIAASNGEAISTLSNNVSLHWMGSLLSYAVVTGHQSGSKLYGSSSEDTSIYSKVSDPVAVVSPGASDSAAFSDTAWKAL